MFKDRLDMLNEWIRVGSADIKINYTRNGVARSTHVSMPAPDFVKIESKGEETADILRQEAKDGKCSVPSNMNQTDACFLTTAACGTVGLHDDCWELEALRRFRDSALRAMDAGENDISQYYQTAPQIVRAINCRKDAEKIWRDVYRRDILPSAILAKLGLNKRARKRYNKLMERMQRIADIA